VILGNTSDDVIQVTGSVDIKGYQVVAPTAQDLGSGTTSTLSIDTSISYLDAGSITGVFEPSLGGDIHIMTMPDGDIHGQKFIIIVEGSYGEANDIPILLDGSFQGSVSVLSPPTQAIEFVWISTATNSKWYQIS
jgi:hypothetical protein